MSSMTNIFVLLLKRIPFENLVATYLFLGILNFYHY